MKKTSTLFILGILAVILVIGYAGYTFWQKSAANVELEKTNNSISEYKNSILKYENERVLQAVSAKQTLDELKTSNVKWSSIIRDIRTTLPKDANNLDLVDILSYSGSNNNDISLSMKTIGTSENPFIDVAKVIASFTNSKNFSGSFVPSIGIGKDKNGGDVLNFAMTTKYVKTDVEGLLDETVVDSVVPKTAR
jgi:hypothetical protein